MSTSEWGPWCRDCGHPASYHGVEFCQVEAGAGRKKPCDCTRYAPEGYPTQEAYDRACEALRKHRGEVERLRDALRIIRDAHAEPDQPGASCAEGCGGRWPCTAWWEAEAVLDDRETRA